MSQHHIRRACCSQCSVSLVNSDAEDAESDGACGGDGEKMRIVMNLKMRTQKVMMRLMVIMVEVTLTASTRQTTLVAVVEATGGLHHRYLYVPFSVCSPPMPEAYTYTRPINMIMSITTDIITRVAVIMA